MGKSLASIFESIFVMAMGIGVGYPLLERALDSASANYSAVINALSILS